MLASTVVHLLLLAPLATPCPAPPPAPAPLHIRPEPIARAAGHPGPLTVEEEATSELSKGFGKAIWAATVSSADGSFGHVDILLVDGGSFLSPQTTSRLDADIRAPAESLAAIQRDLDAQLAAATRDEDRARVRRELAELAQLRRGDIAPRLMRLPDGASGYVSMLGFGPGGAAFIAAMPAPDHRFDLLVLTGSSLDSIARQASPRSAAYEEAMRTRPLAVTEAIARAIYGQLFPSPPEKKGKTSHR